MNIYLSNKTSKALKSLATAANCRPADLAELVLEDLAAQVRQGDFSLLESITFPDHLAASEAASMARAAGHRGELNLSVAA